MLWINPFLDVFYEWGRKQGYWETKREVVIFLNGAWALRSNDEPELFHLFQGNINRHSSTRIPIKPIIDYLEENVPEWYYRHGHGWNVNIGGEINEVIEAWENPHYYGFEKPILADDQSEAIIIEMESGYPKELMVDGKYYLDTYPPSDYVQLLNINTKRGSKTVLNSLYFTTVKGQSWCNVSSPSRFINWTEDPFEEVKG